jgi:hypothetical protein
LIKDDLPALTRAEDANVEGRGRGALGGGGDEGPHLGETMARADRQELP